MERTFVLLKPDAIQRGLIGRIVERFDRRGYRMLAMKMLVPSRDQAEQHYAVHRDKFFFSDLVDHLTSGPVLAMVLEAPDAIVSVRNMLGATRPSEATGGTIRGDLGQTPMRNLVHAADSVESYEHEHAVYFVESEIMDYQRPIDHWVFEPEE